MSTERALVEKQLQSLSSLSRVLDNFKKVGKNNYTAAKIRSRITTLKEDWARIRDYHATITAAISSTSKQSLAYFKDHQYEIHEEVYQSTLDYMTECLEELEPYVNPNHSFDNGAQRNGSTHFSLSHLPPITLPPFSGKSADWESFRDWFTSLIIDVELSDFARMHFLSSCLKDRALECLGNISIIADNFKVAWTALKDRYENKRRLVSVHISTLLNLTAVPRESAHELEVLRDKVKYSCLRAQ